MRHLILVKHSRPEIIEDLPASEWRLSWEGQLRAERLAAKLLSYQPEILFSSPEPKAKETAEIIGRNLRLPVQVLEDLHEHKRSNRGYLSKEVFERAISAFFANPDRLMFGEETANEAQERFSSAVNSVLEENANRRVVIVSHGTVISLFVSGWTGQSDFQIWSKLGLPSFFVLDMESRELIAFENVL